MKVNILKAAVLTGTDGPTLQTALNAFFAASGERTYVECRLSIAAGEYVAVVLYTE